MRLLLSALALTLALASGTVAQPLGSLQQDARATVPSVEALGMGGAALAAPSHTTAQFYNPAHLARVATLRPRITIAGLSLSGSDDLMEKLDFVDGELIPLIDDGLASADYSQLSQDERDRLEGVYDRALELGRESPAANVVAYGPSVQIQVANVALAAGLYGHSVSRGRFTNAGAGIPQIDLYTQADIIGAASFATELDGVALGVTGRYVQRYITAKQEVIDAIDPDAEQLLVLSGQTLALDAGAHYALPFGLSVGVSVYDILGGDMTYELDRSWNLGSEEAAPDPAEVAALEARFNARSVGPTVGVGVAYDVPLTGPFASVTLAADYLGASSSEFDQTFATKLRVGARANVGPLAVRAGFAQGFPTAGLGVDLRYARLDYAFYPVEDGRYAGQRRRLNHAVQLTFGL